MVVLLQVALMAFIATSVFSQTAAPRRTQEVPRQVERERQFRYDSPDGPRRSPQRSAARRLPAIQPKPKPSGPQADAPRFSYPGGIYTNALELKLEAKSDKATIRYTLDGTEPGENSKEYSEAISIRETVVVRAACFEPGKAPSTAATHTYTMLGDDLIKFTSNLPLVVIDAFDQRLGLDEYMPASIRFINTSGGRSSLLGAADYDGRTELKRRGFSSIRFPKMSMTLKTRDDDGNKAKASIFGMPSESDWVLYAPYVDKTLMRDVLGYELSNHMGRYAPRTRFVEVFIHYSAGKLTYRDYAGVYVLVEKIKRDKARVNIAKLDPDDNAEPDISGGYILKRDHGASGGGRGGSHRPPNDGVGFVTPRGLHLFHVEPDEDELTPAQQKWIASYFTSFERALHGSKFASPTEGYAKYLDVDAFIDHFLLVEMTKNIDGFRYSAYLHKPRNGKITMGPAWDWNLSFGNADYYDAAETRGWYYENLRDREISWIFRLKQDPEFNQRLVDRWAQLRSDTITPEKLLARIDAIRNELHEAQTRNFRRWPVLGRQIKPNDYVGPTYDAEVNWMKIWAKDRIAWMDQQSPRAPRISQKSGQVAAGSRVTLAPNGTSGEIYYTMNGSDPRAVGGDRSEGARKYDGAITIQGNTTITARLRRGQSWSGPVVATYTTK
jgi:hypothetical protein